MSSAPAPSAANAAAAAKVQELINTVTSLGRTALEYEPEMAETALQLANNLVDCLADLDGVKNGTSGTYVPLDLVTWIDEGKNYETFTRELVQRTASENQFICGKVWALEVRSGTPDINRKAARFLRAEVKTFCRRLRVSALLKTFREVLEAELQKTYPDEFAAYCGFPPAGEDTEMRW